MASYRGHLIFSTALGIGYGALAHWYFGYDEITSGISAGLTSASGLLPDLDSDSGVPVRALFGLSAVVIPLLMLRRLLAAALPPEQMIAILAGTYLTIRYGLAALFKRITVHRGMFHSIPAMLIAGLAVFLIYQHPQMDTRFCLAGGVMLGFLSHLVLDELCSVKVKGVGVHLNKAAGSALPQGQPSQ
jgi:membrane-bound metal-dependent hydrolase YbcI (DUF457 family)